MLSLLSGAGITLWDILAVTVPSTLIGVVIGALLSLRSGKNLADDPEYQRRVNSGELVKADHSTTAVEHKRRAIGSIAIFMSAMVVIVMLGSVETLRPEFLVAGSVVRLDMPSLIEIVMLSAAAVIMLSCRVTGEKVAHSSVFSAGMQAVVAIFGIAWLGDTFIQGNLTEIKPAVEQIVTQMPWLFGVALFVMSILLYSQAATVRAFMPLGIALGLSPMLLIALFPAVNGYFFIPNYPTLVAAINFDRTGSTRIGKFILNHSFMKPGLVATVVSVAVGLLLITLY
jgi:anaerobic C4-dicarboxylate transporter DcuA